MLWFITTHLEQLVLFYVHFYETLLDFGCNKSSVFLTFTYVYSALFVFIALREHLLRAFLLLVKHGYFMIS